MTFRVRRLKRLQKEREQGRGRGRGRRDQQRRRRGQKSKPRVGGSQKAVLTKGVTCCVLCLRPGEPGSESCSPGLQGDGGRGIRKPGSEQVSVGQRWESESLTARDTREWRRGLTRERRADGSFKEFCFLGQRGRKGVIATGEGGRGRGGRAQAGSVFLGSGISSNVLKPSGKTQCRRQRCDSGEGRRGQCGRRRTGRASGRPVPGVGR